MKTAEKIRVKDKPDLCVCCGSSNIATYLYGLPAFSQELQKSIDEGSVVLAGCLMTDDDPIYMCSSCKTQYFKIKRKTSFASE